MNKEQKAAVVEQLTRELSDAEAVLAVDYRGISVPQAAELRSNLNEAGTRFRVVKNRLTLRAADAAGAEALKEHLSGPTALALIKDGDVALAAKAIARLGSEWELLTYKGGLMDGEELDPDSFTQIARLPGRDALNAQFAGIVASPLTGLVRGLGSMVQGLASQLQQIADQGLVSGEAPAPETPDSDEAPAQGEESSQAADEVEEPPSEEGAESESGDEERGAEAAGETSGEGEGDSSSEEGGKDSSADPDPTQSPEESTAEEPAPGDDVPSEEVTPPDETGAPVGEGDAQIGSARGEEPAAADTAEQQEATDGSEGGHAEQQETSGNSDQDKEDQD